MKIGEVAKITGLSEHTLRFYEKEKLLCNIAKRAGGIRDYGPRDLNTLGVIECLKKSGMPLSDIRQFMAWCAQGDKTIQQRYEMFLERRRVTQEKIKELTKMLKIIDFKANYYGKAMRAGTLAIYEKNPPKMPDFFNE